MNGQPPPAPAGGNAVDHGLRFLWSLVQQYGFLLMFLGAAGFFAKGKWDEYRSQHAVRELNDSERTARMRAEMLRTRERQQQKARDIVKASLEAEKKRKHEERERHRRALEAVENYDASKHDGFDAKKNPLMSGGHGKNFTNRPRFGRVKPGCGSGG